MRLTAPTQIVFLISVIIAIIALLGIFHVFAFGATASFWLMTIAFIILLIGNVTTGL